MAARREAAWAPAIRGSDGPASQSFLKIADLVFAAGLDSFRRGPIPRAICSLPATPPPEIEKSAAAP
jgi:hypothetical protein